MIRLGRKRIKSPASVLQGVRLYLRLFARAGILLGLYASHVQAQQLPVPCGGGACGGGPSVWVTSGQVQAPTVTANTMHITQQSDKAILNWASFDVGSGATVDFSQPSSSSVALNRIYQSDASQINGAVHANGQIYLINQNGIVFGKGSQVDVHGLVASTLDVSDQVFNSSGIAQAINQTTPAAAFQTNGKMGNINIAQGAVIKTDDGGQVMIFAPNITNNGEIDTPQGQTILAASQDKIYLKFNTPNDPGLRGFLVEVNQGGTVTNGGKVSVGEGNATLEGLTVNQNGLVSATTSVQLNGSIRLLARDQVNTGSLADYSQGNLSQITAHTGTVTFGPGSTTQVQPDTSDVSTTVDDQTQLPSTVDVMGKTIDLKGDSKIVVPGGQVNLSATVNPQNQNLGASTIVPPNDSRILMEAQSLIDVSGTTSTVLPMSRNSVQVQLRANELADSPLQRDGILYGQTVTVDVRKGTPLANVSGAIQGIKRSVSERLSAGGTVTSTSEGDVVVAQGADINFSGGKVTYQGGYLNTTKLFTQNGTVVDIGDADPNQTYTAILGAYQQNHPTWGVTQNYKIPGIATGSSYTPGYVQGMDAGTFSIQAHGVVLDGQLQGSAADGALQRLAPTILGDTPSWERPYDQLPLGGQLIIGNESQAGHSGADLATPSVVFENQVTPVTNLDASFVNQTVELAPGLLSSSGINRVGIYSNGSISVPSGVDVNLAPGGTLSLVAGPGTAPAGSTAAAPSIEMDGAINIPGGSVNMASQVTTHSNTPDFLSVVMGQDSEINVGGMWVNDSSLLNPAGAAGPAVVGGGSVKIQSIGNLTMNQGSLINASGGAEILSDGTVEAGSGGAISLSSNNTGFVTSITLDGTLRADALYQGGTLSLTADGIQIQTSVAGKQAQPGELLLDPVMFQNSGFSGYNLAATQSGLSIADGASIDLVQQNRVLNPGYQNQYTGTDMVQFSHLQQLPLVNRRPVNISLKSSRTDANPDVYHPNAALTVGTGAVIQTDPGAHVSLNSDRMITVDGTIDAPAGAIDLTLGSGPDSEGFFTDKAIWLAPGARLEAPAFVVPIPNALGLAQGKVLDGGTISLRTQQGLIVTAAGSTMDVSGTHQLLSVLSNTGTGSNYVSSDVAGAAGNIELTAADGVYLDGAMNAKAAPVAGAAGGSLSVTLTSSPRANASQDTSVVRGVAGYYAPQGPRSIQVGSGAVAVQPLGTTPGDSLFSPTQLAQLQSSSINAVPSVAYLSAAQIQQAGFDSVDLQVRPVLNPTSQVQPTSSAAIEFNGNVNLTAARQITLDTPVLLSTQDGQVQLSAPYVAVGPTDTVVHLSSTPSAGGGSLSVDANFIDLIGNTELQGFGSGTVPAAQLQATQDIRLQGIRFAGSRDITGSFQAAGDLQLRAGQVYPSTLTQFDLNVVNDPQGTIQFSASGTATSAPLSAGGVLTVSAPNIIQGGTVRAPFGDIELNASQALQLQTGSVTSVSGNGLTVPFGQTQLGQDWIIPYQTVGTEVPNSLLSVVGQQVQAYDIALPSKQVTLNAPSVSLAKGATIDVSGGGDMYAYEFEPGPGGSEDILSAANAGGAFAVVPNLGSFYAPVDPVISSQGLQPGDTIYLSGGNGLAAGEYAMLPARYALLPGAYLVRPVPGTAGMTSGQSYSQFSGIPIVAGRQGVAGTDNIHASLWSGYAVENGTQVRQQAQYTESYANTFFTADVSGAPTKIHLPQDAGTVTIAATQDLTLSGRLNGQSDNGSGSQVDIVAPALDVVTSTSNTATGVQILASDLNNLGADSIMLGGRRQVNDSGVTVQAEAQSVRIDDGVTLTLPELLLVSASGQDINGNVQPGQVTVASGAALNGSGNAKTDEGTLILSGDSALLRVSAGTQPALERTDLPSAPTAQLTVAAGAQLTAGNADASGNLHGGSIMLDTAGSAQSSGDTVVGDGGALYLGASHITLGDAGSQSSNQGLVLSNAELGKLDVTNLSLISGSGIDVYGDAAVKASSLTLQAQTINGYANDAQTAVLKADTLNLLGSIDPASGNGTGTGTLSLQARQLNVGAGNTSSTVSTEDLTVSGFDQINVDADAVTFLGSGQFHVTGATTITTGQLSGTASSNWTVSTPDALGVLSKGQAAAASTTPILGAVLGLQGSRLSFDSTALMPSGRLALTATGSDAGDAVIVGPDASIDVSGRVVDYSGTSAASPGGQVDLKSANGDVQIQSGSKINVAGGSDAAGAGGVTIQAPSGQVTIDGDLTANQAPGGDGQGSFSLDAASLGNFASLTANLNQGGFTGSVAVRTRNGDLAVAAGDTFRAHDLTLTADSGSIDIAGLIDASGAQAGQVSINAGSNLTMDGTAVIDAHATGDNAKGGTVLLGTSQGSLTFAQGAVIDVTGTQASDVQVKQGGQTATRTDTGLVQFRIPRAALTSSDLSGVVDGIEGAGSTVVEADQVYNVSNGTLGGSAVAASSSNPYYQDAVTFMQNETSIMAGLGLDGGASVQLRPGVVLQAPGSLTLSAPLDLSKWRFGPEDAPGVLTLRATGNLDINQELSAGFNEGVVNPYTGIPTDILRQDDSWSLRMIAGADLSSADPLAVNAGSGNVTIGNNVAVRTGTGNIDIAAGADLVLSNNQSVVYTSGADGGPGTYDPLYLGLLLNGQFPVGGGDLRVAVDRDILAQASQQLINDWQPRLGGSVSLTSGSQPSNLPTTWGINFAKFQQGVGALGGGNVSVTAGGNISDLSVVMPSIGTQVGQAVYNGAVTLKTNQVVVTGGTQLNVNAGGDISGGIYYAGQGQGVVRAGGAIGPSQQTSLDPVLAMGDAQFNVVAGGNVGLEDVVNPTMLPQSKSQFTQLTALPYSYFYTYGPDSAVHLTSLAGDISFSNNSVLLGGALNITSTPTFTSSLETVYPGTLSATALQGDINLGQNDFTLFPAAQGQLTLLASGSVMVGGAGMTINVSDADPNALPGVTQPVTNVNATSTTVLSLDPRSPALYNHASVPVHTGDAAPVLIVASDGFLGAAPGTDGLLQLFLPKPFQLIAGQDVRNTAVVGQNLTADDISIVQAGRDAVFTSSRNTTTGILINKVQAKYSIAGPGQLDIVAGRDVDLGTSVGVISLADTENPALPATGASVLLLAGMSETPDYNSFVQTYLVNSSQYQSQLGQFLSQYPSSDSTLSDIDRFKALPLNVQRKFILQVFFSELRASGIAAANSQSKDYSRGFDAINTLFPGSLGNTSGTASGNLKMLLSRVTTLTGGDITLVVPYGLINAGTANTSAVSKNPSQLGIMVQGNGNINAYVRGDLEVNQSRVFTLDGGDILIWSSLGNIDAGRGAKTAVAVPPPIVTVDNSGNIILQFPPVIAGSGIRAAVTTPGRAPGNVYLFAPQGVVNAGDAGITSAGNLTISAIEVTGSDNISVGGNSVGIPVVNTGGLAASLTGVSNVTSGVTQSTQNTVNSLASNEVSNTPLADAALSYLQVVVIGLGNQPVDNGDSE